MQENEKLRQDFVNDYTKEKIKNLTFEEYAIGYGKNNKSFCYRLEYELHDLGSIRNAPSGKFGVWFGTTGKDKTKAKRCNSKFGTTPEEGLETAKEEIISLIDAGKNDDYATILNSKFSPLVRGKILYIYYPDKYIPIFSEDHLKHFLKKLECGDFGNNHIEMQKRLLEYKNSHNATKRMNNEQFHKYLYETFPPKGYVKDPDACDEKNKNDIIAASAEKFSPVHDFTDTPAKKTKVSYMDGKKYYPRDPKNSKQAIALAENRCEYDNSHKSFIKKSNKTTYMEAHHIIPMSAQGKRFIKSGLDVPANIVSLCSECHNRIHYGEDGMKIVEKLFNDRKERLEKCGLSISIEELYKCYDNKKQ